MLPNSRIVHLRQQTAHSVKYSWKFEGLDKFTAALAAARVWGRYESHCSTLRPSELPAGAGSGESLLAIAKIEAHYFANDIFLEDGQLLRDVGRIAHLPAAIIQGRYDMICPPQSADALARAWPGADYVIVDDAGHSAMEPGIRAALVRATEAFKGRIG